MVGSLYFKISNTIALAVAAAEENVACRNGYAVASQTAGNLHLAVKISFAVLVIGIGQLACQSIQCIVNRVRINSQALITGNQVNYRTLFCMFDDCIASIIGYAVTCMLIKNIGVTAVIINGQRVAVLLEDIAGSCCLYTTS